MTISATLQLEPLWIQDVTIGQGLVDAATTPIHMPRFGGAGV
jgi:hypothetical protein